MREDLKFIVQMCHLIGGAGKAAANLSTFGSGSCKTRSKRNLTEACAAADQVDSVGSGFTMLVWLCYGLGLPNRQEEGSPPPSALLVRANRVRGGRHRATGMQGIMGA